MPLLSRLQAFSFNTESWFSTSSFIIVKNLLLLINFLSMLAGIILIATGGYINSSAPEDFANVAGSIAAAAIVIGSIIAIVSFLGCFGAANEKGLLLKTYFALLLVLVILEISVGAAAYAKRDTIDGTLTAAWRDTAISNNATILRIEKAVSACVLSVLALPLSRFLDAPFKCCGYATVTDMAVPENCVQALNFTSPCSDQLRSTVTNSLSTIGGAGVAIGIIELVGLVFSAILFRKIAAKENAQNSLLNEAWRVNRTKVQYGYQNYQYV
ncbi:Tetraspanin family-domain-containing protein [Entophlyctis helioformis]|nr:Tetraspanin family-domain-containing protein [Entophlyctis helioformis]